jgi:hypothetical protein
MVLELIGGISFLAFLWMLCLCLWIISPQQPGMHSESVMMEGGR